MVDRGRRIGSTPSGGSFVDFISSFWIMGTVVAIVAVALLFEWELGLVALLVIAAAAYAINEFSG